MHAGCVVGFEPAPLPADFCLIRLFSLSTAIFPNNVSWALTAGLLFDVPLSQPVGMLERYEPQHILSWMDNFGSAIC